MQTKNGLPFSNKKKEESLVTLTTQVSNMNDQVSEVNTQLAQITYDDIVRKGAKKDGTVDISTVLNQLKTDGSKRFYLPAGTFLLSNTVTLPENAVLIGAGAELTIIKSNITGNADLFTVGNGVNENTDSLRVEGITFRNDNASPLDGYAFNINGNLNAVFENCYFKNLGGGAVTHTNTSNVTMDKCYVFGCGKNPTYQSPSYGALHISRSGGYANSFNIMNSYISNCTFMSGINISSHSLRIVNTTIESCHTLLKIGDPTYVSRNISVFGLYLENPKTYGIDMINVLSGVFLNTYVNDTSSTATKSVKVAGSSRVKFINCSLGDKGFDVEENCSDIKFDDCIGSFPADGISGVNEPLNVRDVNLASGFFGYANNYIVNSNDFSTWTGNVTVTTENGFVDGTSSFVLSKTVASDEKYVNITNAFVTGNKVVGSIYLNGSAAYKLRGRRTSDNVFEDIKTIIVTTDKWKRVFVSATLDKDYNLITFRVTPGSYSIASATCKVAKGQFELGRLIPSAYINTTGTAVKSNVNASINGDYISSGKLVGYRSAMPTSGTFIQGDYIHNTNPSVQGTAGSQYVVKGWIRLTTGSGNVLNTDWVEDRGVTGT